ncbi:MAG: YicC/YloC family endoribonuclease [Planctomycetaceae bacterium]|nr:YicC/YloC family endoribonuclease [Planctomycetaceae bacterium]
MLLSMTGFGEATEVVAGVHVTAELRSVNNRHFKLTLRAPDAWLRFEPEWERILRERVSRGTVTLTLRPDRSSTTGVMQINAALLTAYWNQLGTIAKQLGAMPPGDLVAVASLPGIVDSSDWAAADAESAAPDLDRLIRTVVEKFQSFRVAEGQAMATDLLGHGAVITKEVERVAEFAPQVGQEFRKKLQQRIQDALKDANVAVEPNDLLREVAMFADRADISEEIVRLRSHLEQFQQLFKADGSQGRKLDFLCQEMFREANTIGSKANHVGVSHAAVEIKTAIERMREVVQNVE